MVGSQSRGTIGRFFLGSAAQSLVTNAACSVRVSRKNERQNSEVRLVIGVDGSGHSSAAIDAVIGRYEKRDCHVRVVSATDLRSYPSITSFDLVEPATEAQILVHQQEIKRAEDAAAKAASELEEAGFSVSCIIENEDPRELIVRQAKEWNADCVFVGARGINRIERILLGSVSSYVAARSECSVEIVR